MSLIDANIWAALEAESIPQGSLSARYAALDITNRLYCAVDSNRRRHFVIPLAVEDEELADDSSRGLTVRTSEMRIAGQEMARYLDLECNDRAGYEAFDYIGSHITQLLGETNLSPVEVVSRVLTRWRRFWGQIPRDLLSREAIIGLFGEVWFLSTWLIPRSGTPAVSSWRGPYGERHDFQRPGHSVEVKTTTSTQGRIHRIQGLDQMEPPDGGSLHLFSLRLREEASGTESLPALIEACMQQLSSTPLELAQFETALAEVGYLPLQAPEYEQVRFRIEEQALFEVRDDFPRITTTNFSEGLPAGIERVQYVINLNAFDHLCVARTPKELELFDQM